MTFLSDFGLADEFVGVVHRVIRGLAPSAVVIDLTHMVPAHDVRAGALALWRSAPWLGPGVVLGVVDPGVGTGRRAVAIEAARGDLVFVGPDNGLLTPAVHRFGPPRRAVSLAPLAPGGAVAAAAPHGPGAMRAAGRAGAGEGQVGATFDGRDLFAPVVARLCAGAELAEVGEPFDPAGLVGGPLALAEEPPEVVARWGVDAEVLWVDRYGNAQLGVRPEVIDILGPSVAVTVPAGSAAGPAGSRRRAGAGRAAGSAAAGSAGWAARRARGYAELGAGQLGLIPDSAGLAALCLDRASAAAALGLAAGDFVHLGSATERH